MVRRHQHQSELALQHDAARDRRDAEPRLGPHHQHLVDQRPEGSDRADQLRRGDIGFTKALAKESASKGITVNIIAPGYIATEMVMAVPPEILKSKILPHIPVGRLGEPEEIARCVVFLASEEAGFITGSTISINGGQHMH